MLDSRSFEDLGVSVGTSATELFNISVAGRQFLAVDIFNTGAVAFNTFVIRAKMHPGAAYQNLYSTLADYDQPLHGILIGVSAANLSTLPGGTAGVFILEPKGLSIISATATVASGTTIADIRGNIESSG